MTFSPPEIIICYGIQVNYSEFKKSMSYLLLKTLHILFVVTSFTLFFLRGIWNLNGSAIMQKQWIKTVPHAVDTLLLITALTLTFTIRQFPCVDAWLTAKVIGLLCYIGLGFVVLHSGVHKVLRLVAWLSAQIVFAYIVLVAITHSAAPW